MITVGKISRIFNLVLVSFLMAALTWLPIQTVYAGNLLNRSVILGSYNASAVTNHQYQFDIVTTNNVGSIVFQYCEAPLVTDPCVAPSGVDVSNVGLAGQTGETGFGLHANTTSNRIVISRAPLANTPGTVSYDFNNALNPDTPNHTTYVRISTYTSDDGTGSFADNGAVAFSLTPALGVNVFVPPYLTFCVGITVALECQAATGNYIDLGILSAQKISSSTSQFAGATNDESGYSVFVEGTTMTSGNNEIARLASPTAAVAGSQQFGINLVANTAPGIGTNPDGSGTLLPTPTYGAQNNYSFNPGDVIATTTSPTEYNRLTVSYIVNIINNQPPGVYSTTLTYVAVATF